MSPFLIFAISLTIAYAIYYAVMITRGLYGNKEEGLEFYIEGIETSNYLKISIDAPCGRWHCHGAKLGR